MQKLDIRKSDNIVCYEKNSILYAPRAFWMLKTFGAPNVYLLNTTFEKWEEEKRPIDKGDSPNAWKRIRKTEPAKDDFDYKLKKD